MKIHVKTRYADEDVIVVFRRYAKGPIGITLVGMDDIPFATATVYVAEAGLAPDEVIIKNYSENEGIEDALVAAGLIEVTDRVISMGYVVCSVSKLTPLALEEAAKQGVTL